MLLILYTTKPIRHKLQNFKMESQAEKAINWIEQLYSTKEKQQKQKLGDKIKCF